MGPVGSAKTSHVATWILDKAQRIRPCLDGVRRSRTLITRSTYPELKSAWLATWKQWYGGLSVVKDGDVLTVDVNIKLPDGTRVEWQGVLIALSHIDDLSKLRGVEFTNAVINEGSTCADWILKEVQSRNGRYPAKWQLGLAEDEVIANGPDYYSGVVIDTNPPEEGASPCDPMANWVYRMMECVAPKEPTIKVIKQPGALIRTWNEAKEEYDYFPNPAATYAKLQSKGYNYWLDQLPTLYGEEDKIKILILGEYGMVAEGTPVFPQYKEKFHETQEDLVEPGRTVVVACDTSGNVPALVVMQRNMRVGKIICHDELTNNLGLEDLIYNHLKPLLEEKYPRCLVLAVLDPSNPGQSGDLMTAQMIFAKAGIPAVLAYSNLWDIRKNTVTSVLRSNTLLLGPRMFIARQGFKGKYVYAHDRTGQAAKRPKKTRPYADIQDAIQYGCMYYQYGEQRSQGLPPPPEQRRRQVA